MLGMTLGLVSNADVDDTSKGDKAFRVLWNRVINEGWEVKRCSFRLS